MYGKRSPRDEDLGRNFNRKRLSEHDFSLASYKADHLD